MLAAVDIFSSHVQKDILNRCRIDPFKQESDIRSFKSAFYNFKDSVEQQVCICKGEPDQNEQYVKRKGQIGG